MSFPLRCDRCRHDLGESAEEPMQLAYLVKAGVGPKIPELPKEKRRRCRRCGFVNIFVPLRLESAFTIL